MNKLPFLLLALALTIFSAAEVMASDAERQKQQAALDAACEAARKRKIAIERPKAIEQCVKKKERPDRASCERFYADFGQRSGNRPAMYYDLPECEEAHAFRNSYRSSGR